MDNGASEMMPYIPEHKAVQDRGEILRDVGRSL